MKKSVLNAFMKKVDEYNRTLLLPDEEEVMREVERMEDWVEENKDNLDCDSLEELFDEYEDMLSYMNNYYVENAEGQDDYDMTVYDEDEMRIREFRDYCLQGSQNQSIMDV